MTHICKLQLKASQSLILLHQVEKQEREVAHQRRDGAEPDPQHQKDETVDGNDKNAINTEH